MRARRLRGAGDDDGDAGHKRKVAEHFQLVTKSVLSRKNKPSQRSLPGYLHLSRAREPPTRRERTSRARGPRAPDAAARSRFLQLPALAPNRRPGQSGAHPAAPPDPPRKSAPLGPTRSSQSGPWMGRGVTRPRGQPIGSPLASTSHRALDPRATPRRVPASPACGSGRGPAGRRGCAPAPARPSDLPPSAQPALCSPPSFSAAAGAAAAV